MWRVLLWSCSLACISRALGDAGPELSIIGGNVTSITSHPYQVSIWSGDVLRGSGAMVAGRWALTTASILIGYEAASLRVRCCSSLAAEGGTLTNVSRVLIHPGFRFRVGMTMDAALLLLSERPIVLSALTPLLALARSPLPADATACLTGWGSTSNSSKWGDQLRAVWVRPLPCSHAHNREDTPTTDGQSQFCAGPVGAYGPCWGDGGDLLVYEGRLYGLLSWNGGCFEPAAPSVFTAAQAVRRWVLRITSRCCGRKKSRP